MSVFSKLKRSKKAAADHKAKVAEKETPDVVPYKHVPTHAAVDALSGAPSTWKSEDRSKIKEHHKRRSAMVLSRTGSSLSTMSYMNGNAGPSSAAPPLPRNSSYNSYNPTWNDRTGDVYHAVEHHQKRLKPPRGYSYHDSGLGSSVGPSPLGSNQQSEEVSPVVSSGNSTTSNNSDTLEIRPTVPKQYSHSTARQQPNVYADHDIFDRLHTSTGRKIGEAPLYDVAPPLPKVHNATVVEKEAKPKKQKWSLMGKRNSTSVVA